MYTRSAAGIRLRYVTLVAVVVMALVLGLVTAVQRARSSAAPEVVDAGAPVAESGATIDALPTVQINGVVWSQAVSGNTVYAGGAFTSARPAGSPAGTNETARRRLVAYDITTGAMTSFNADLNSTVRAVAVAPNGTVYVGGDFTRAKGAVRYRIAAYTPSGNLISTFAPNINGTVRALAATNDTVFVGGDFTTAEGVARNRLAAFTTDGWLTSWDPSADDQVFTMVLTPSADRVVAGGRFTTLGGVANYGMGAISTQNAATKLSFEANKVIQDAGPNGAIWNLSSDGKGVYGAGYDYGTGANFEGSFSADLTTGAIRWLEDCHGDSYSAFPLGGAVYTVSHAHDCSTIGGFPQKVYWHRALAFTNEATHKVIPTTAGSMYKSFTGQPAPTLLSWYPLLEPGKYTGQGQAAWNISGNSKYLTLGGEFPMVNGTAQQGLVRFAMRSVAGNPQKHGPELAGSALNPTLSSTADNTVKVTLPDNWDRDNHSLTYKIVRDGDTANPVYTGTATTDFWNLKTQTWTDAAAPAGTRKYRIYWLDSALNTSSSSEVSVTVKGVANPGGGGEVNSPPKAVFSSTVSALKVSVDASASTDADGTIVDYSWDFGDGKSGSGKITSNTYTAAGTYSVVLTVTDDKGSKNSTSKSVTVADDTPPPPPPPPGRLAADTFTRTATNSFGTADTGGAWSAVNSPSALAVDGSVGRITLAKGGSGGAVLNSASALDATMTMDTSLTQVPAGGSVYLYVGARKIDASSYRAKLIIATNRSVQLRLVSVVNGKETMLSSTTVTGYTFTVGSAIRVKLSVAGSGTTTLRAKAWDASKAEPASWMLTSTDSTAVLQQPGGLSISGYNSGNSTNPPAVVLVDNLSATAD